MAIGYWTWFALVAPPGVGGDLPNFMPADRFSAAMRAVSRKAPCVAAIFREK